MHTQGFSIYLSFIFYVDLAFLIFIYVEFNHIQWQGIFWCVATLTHWRSWKGFWLQKRKMKEPNKRWTQSLLRGAKWKQAVENIKEKENFTKSTTWSLKSASLYCIEVVEIYRTEKQQFCPVLWLVEHKLWPISTSSIDPRALCGDGSSSSQQQSSSPRSRALRKHSASTPTHPPTRMI